MVGLDISKEGLKKAKEKLDERKLATKLIQAPTVSIPVDSPGAEALMCLAAKHNVVLIIHMETTTETVPALERALERNPHTKVIWAHQYHFKTVDGPVPEHARKADPEQVAALMGKYPHLYADIAPAMRYFTEEAPQPNAAKVFLLGAGQRGNDSLEQSDEPCCSPR
jgi:hypothetical protein